MAERIPGRRWPGILTVSLVLPLLAAWVLIWSTSGRQDALDRVPVAIVNDDTILTDPQPMAAGRALAASLTDPSASTRLDWTLTGADDARDGLRDGTYYAVLTIPSDFSAAIVSTGTSTPSSGKLTLQSNAAASQTVPWISDQVVAAAADALGTQATQGYLSNVYGGFNQLAKATKKSAQGADQLAGGTKQLAAGASELDSGTHELADGLGQVAAGAAELETGTTGVSDGAGALARSSRELAGGAGALSGAVGELADRSGVLARRAEDYAVRSGEAARAQRLVARGAARLSTAAGRLSGDLGDLARTCRTTGAGREFCRQLREARIRSRVVDAGTRVLARGTDGLGEVGTALADGADKLADGDRALAAGTRKVSGASGRLARSSRELAGGAGRLAGAADEVADATVTLAGGTASSSEAASSLATGSDNLATSAGSADAGAQQLSQGLAKESRKSPTYSSSEQSALVAAVSEPVVLDHTTDHADHDNGWLLAAIIGVILWLAALAGAARADVTASRRFALSAVSSRRIATSQALPVLGLGLLQGVAVLLALALTRASVASAVALTLLSLLAALSFTAIGFALRLAFGAAGVAVFGLFLLLQVAALANVLPLETAPALLQTLNGVLPLTAYVDGASQLVSGGEVHPLSGSVVVVSVWGVAALLATLPVVRRQRLLPPTRPAPVGLGGA